MFNDTKVKQLKPSDKLYRVADHDGLCIEVRPTMHAGWMIVAKCCKTGQIWLIAGQCKYLLLDNLFCAIGHIAVQAIVSKTAGVSIVCDDPRQA